MSNCNVCDSRSGEIFKARILSKYDVSYFQCSFCGFIQTEHPYWLQEAYENAITSLDIGLVSRNINNGKVVEKLIQTFFDENGRFIDYGGGYGLFVRLMRDKGFAFYRQDIFCENLFANHFDIKDLEGATKFELLTAFEVFEHVEFPFQDVKKMMAFSDSILFTTELQPSKHPTPQSWWYFVPETGQHISFYTKRSLEIIAEKSGLNFHSWGNFHLFTGKTIPDRKFRKIISHPGSMIERVMRKLSLKKERPSLLTPDFELILEKITK